MTLRLPNRRPIWLTLLVVVPLAAVLGLFVLAIESEPPPGKLTSAFVVGVDRPTGGYRPLPPTLAVVQLERDAGGMGADHLMTVVMSPGRSSGERYLALRQLERRAPATAAQEAERVVMAARADADEFLALNALATIARLSNGRGALERCAAQAPTPRLRRAAAKLANVTDRG